MHQAVSPRLTPHPARCPAGRWSLTSRRQAMHAPGGLELASAWFAHGLLAARERSRRTWNWIGGVAIFVSSCLAVYRAPRAVGLCEPGLETRVWMCVQHRMPACYTSTVQCCQSCCSSMSSVTRSTRWPPCFEDTVPSLPGLLQVQPCMPRTGQTPDPESARRVNDNAACSN